MRKTRLSEIPVGSCVTNEAETEFYYVSKEERLRPLQSSDIIRSWSFPLTFRLPDRILATYTKGAPMGFRPNSVVISMADHCWYFIDGEGYKRKIVSPDFFKEAGRGRWSFPFVSKRDLELHRTGGDIE